MQAVNRDSSTEPIAKPLGVQVSMYRSPNGLVFLEFDRPVQQMSLSVEQAREMINRLRDLVNGIEPVRKHKKV